MTPHIILLAQSGSLLCQHCCQLDPPPRDMPVERWIDHCRGFILMHKHCEKPAEPSKQVRMFDDLAAKEQRSYSDIAGAALGITRETFVPTAGIDASTSDPAPEIDPPSYCLTCGEDFGEPGRAGHECEHDKPEIDDYAEFAQRYPFPPDVLELETHYLLGVLTPDQWQKLPKPLPWHPTNTQFQLVAAWARIEKAHQDSEARGIDDPIVGLTLPARLPMPEALAVLLKPAKKRGARPLTSGKRRARA